ncbi:hypothetical protein [Faecalibacterium prausnitzii]|jgi:hypothetical protein|uniref:Uncharacterized protein n=1 Tax=Faecalibacterium prausnitzii TaxID=853 RepID=A0A3E2U357_9FIRM|nr:hypothetical protein [Faecalibacterium prausnitzii]RGB90550.1 hypothetical protein DWZ25_01775 [Faecalibacterium prausnitzii]
MKETYSPAILASYATFKELYNEGKYRSPYQILAEFIKYIVLTENTYSFSLVKMKQDLKRVFGFELPTAVIKTAVKGIDGMTREAATSDYVVNNKQLIENVEFVSLRKETEVENLELSKLLLDYAHEYHSDQYIQEDVLVQDFIAYLIDENSNTKNHDIISEFILKNSDDVRIQESIESIRQGAVLYIGLNYNISETGSLGKDLILYLDTEILFDLAGYNGGVYQSIAEDFIDLVRDANEGEHKIKLRYFAEVKSEIEKFFDMAKDIVVGRQIPNNKPAMKSIVNGCREETDVIEKCADFFLKLRTQYSIVEDPIESYYVSSYDSYNLEGIRNDTFPQDEETSEALTYVSHINKLRKGVRYREYTESGYIFVTETSKVLDVSKNMITLLSAEDEMDSIHACGFAQNMSGISNILWYKLNKGFGRKDFPQSLDAVLKAKVVLAKHISQNVSKAYQELKKQYEEGSISKEIMAARMLALREKSEKPEDISIDNVENELDFSPEFYKAYETAIEQNKALLQDKDDLIKKITEKAEFDNKQAEQKIEILEIAAKENKKIQQQLEQQLSTQQIEMHNQKEMIQELQKKEEEQERRKNIRKNWCKLILKVVIRIILIALISGGTYWLCRKMKLDYGTVISIVIGIVGLIPLAITTIKNDYRKLIKELE